MQVLFRYQTKIKFVTMADEMVELEILPRRKEHVLINGFIGEVIHVMHVMEVQPDGTKLQRYIVDIHLYTSFSGAQLFPTT